jgi:hypothetical protein
VQLRGGKPLSIACDAPCAAVTPAAIVELHYVDRKGDRRAEFLFVVDQAAGELSRRPGRSARGVVTRTKKSSLQLQVGTKKRTYELEKKTTLVEPGQWRPAATGRAEVMARVKAGEDILLKYEEHDDSIQAGEVTIPGTALKAVEVRRLKG